MDDVDGLISKVQCRKVYCARETVRHCFNSDDVDNVPLKDDQNNRKWNQDREQSPLTCTRTFDAESGRANHTEEECLSSNMEIIIEEGTDKEFQEYNYSCVQSGPAESTKDMDTSNPRHYLKRINTRESAELNTSLDVSEIFVKHPDEDSEHGDPLGGFLCSKDRSDGTFIHAFCTLDENGILAKDLLIEGKDILVSLNGTMTLESEEYNHERVLELFRTLPLSKTISMEIYNRKKETFTSIEFLLEGNKEDIIVKEHSVKLRSQPPTVEALLYPRGDSSLSYQNGRLTLCKSDNFMLDCKHHFVVKKTLDDDFYLVYTFQVQKNKSKFLGLNGNRLELVDENNTACSKRFRRERINRDDFLRPCDRSNMYVYFNKTNGVYELVRREIAMQEEGFGLNMAKTPCRP